MNIGIVEAQDDTDVVSVDTVLHLLELNLAISVTIMAHDMHILVFLVTFWSKKSMQLTNLFACCKR
jgi:hypothetical protein